MRQPSVDLGRQLAVEAARAEAGARRLYGELTPEINARLTHELDVIGQRGYAPLFLIMAEILAYARRTGVPTASRGSASSSLVAHCLDITTPDPVSYTHLRAHETDSYLVCRLLLE